MLRPALFVFAALLAPLALAWPDGPPPGQVGFGGQEDCSSCHYAGPAPTEASGLRVIGLPDQVKVGRAYEFVLELLDPEARIGGFQALMHGKSAEAGEWIVGESQQVAHLEDKVYLSHDRPQAASPDPGSSLQRIEWRIRWRAPDQPARLRLFIAGVAADDDDSALGDNAYQLSTAIELVR